MEDGEALESIQYVEAKMKGTIALYRITAPAGAALLLLELLLGQMAHSYGDLVTSNRRAIYGMERKTFPERFRWRRAMVRRVSLRDNGEDIR